MRSGREVIGASSARATAESGVSTREGGDCCCLARRGFFFFGVEGVEEVDATELGEAALTEEVALSVATACDSVVDSDLHSPEIVSRSAPASASIFDDVMSIILVRYSTKHRLSLLTIFEGIGFEGSRAYVLDVGA